MDTTETKPFLYQACLAAGLKNSEIIAEELGVNYEKLRRAMKLARKMQKKGKNR
jgi:hypothetical protein